MAGKGQVTIVEVGPRDGLQNEQAIISTEDKLKLIALLAETGLRRIECTAFVSPKWVPQMSDHEGIMRRAARRPGLMLSALVPNEMGARAAIAAGAQEIAVFASASETFALKNTNCTISESITRFRPVLRLAAVHGLSVRGYVSCAVECPYEGRIEPEAVRAVAERLMEIGCKEIAVSDTIGRAMPRQVDEMLAGVIKSVPEHMLACHFHDTSGRALSNVDAALMHGIRTFDSAVGGLGGCPYAPGAAGNLRTEALVAHLSAAGYAHGVDASTLSRAAIFAVALKR